MHTCIAVYVRPWVYVLVCVHYIHISNVVVEVKSVFVTFSVQSMHSHYDLYRAAAIFFFTLHFKPNMCCLCV